MIKVNCVVESAGKKGYPQIEVNSVKDNYGAVELVLSDKKIEVFAEDIIQAIENCAANGRRRWRSVYERRNDSNDEE